MAEKKKQPMASPAKPAQSKPAVAKQPVKGKADAPAKHQGKK